MLLSNVSIENVVYQVQVHSLNVSKGEPIWSINLKRALASELQLHVSKSLRVEPATKNFAFDTNREPSGVFRVVEVLPERISDSCKEMFQMFALPRKGFWVNAKPCTRSRSCRMRSSDQTEGSTPWIISAHQALTSRSSKQNTTENAHLVQNRDVKR